MPDRKQNRLKGYDYGQSGLYYVTVCTGHRMHWFGKVEKGKMVLNSIGDIVVQQWKWLAECYPYVTVDEYCVMPNHFHGILGIVTRSGHDRSLPSKVKPLPGLMGAFKTTSSKLIRRGGLLEFQWQKSYHDRVIRNEKELNAIREYIRNNPLNWETDSER